MATGDLNLVTGTVVQLDNGAAGTLADGAFAVAPDADLATTDNAGYPLVQFMLSATWATSTDIEDGQVNLYRMKIDVETGGGDEGVPDATYPRKWVGAFFPDAVTAEQFMTIDPIPRSNDAERYYLGNATGQTMSAGYILEATPMTYRLE